MDGNMIKAMVLDVKKNSCGVKEIKDDLDTLYELIGCETVEGHIRKIDGVAFDFLMDEEGRYKDDPIVSVVDDKNKPMFVGNVIICHHDDEGNLTSLTSDDCTRIFTHLDSAMRKDGETGIVLKGVSY